MKSNQKKILWGKGLNNLDIIPKIIWIYWDGSSDLVDICIENVKFYLKDFEINILNKKSLKIFLPDILGQREDLPLANYTDLIRLELLYEYGGIWMDASILLTENLDWLFVLKKEDHTDLIGFYSDFCTTNYDYPILETWFLATSRENIFIRKWLMEFRNCYSSLNPTSYYNDLKSNLDLIQNVSYFADYLIAYLSAIKIMRESQDYRILMISANETGHRYNFGTNFNDYEFIDFFLNNQPPSKYPILIKFEKRGRNLLDKKLKIGKFKKLSFLILLSQKESFKKKIIRLYNYLKFILTNISSKILKNE
ncbi:capsular polysaccharide synthesis protein [Chishuiella sp.]|uniref:glycosyltransferase family 32 protein n=1 Tax=Chishuiella sp. TaxID=1969467 RepID=UPI0028AD2B56|nr:capsular polysaccharide synthesis protein [Chishuiella sp.]